MSLGEITRGRTRERATSRSRVPHAEQRAYWVENFYLDEVGNVEQTPVEPIPIPPPLDSKWLFQFADELPHCDRLQVNFARHVRNVSAHMLPRHESIWLYTNFSKYEHACKFYATPKIIIEGQKALDDNHHERDSLLIRSAELLQELTGRSTNELIEALRKIISTDVSAQTNISVEEKVLETFVGYVDQLDGDTAYVRLQSQEHGDVLFGKYPADELASKGICEQSRFQCEAVKVGTSTRLELKALPDVEVSEEELQTIDDRIHRVIPRDDPGIEY